jgi:hypothetical protein
MLYARGENNVHDDVLLGISGLPSLSIQFGNECGLGCAFSTLHHGTASNSGRWAKLKRRSSQLFAGLTQRQVIWNGDV